MTEPPIFPALGVLRLAAARVSVALVLASVTALLGSCAKESSSAAGGSVTMAQIRSRGRLICGINGQLPGFSALETSGVYYGLDLDLCRAVAAAVLGDGSNWSCAP